jgi:class 3 adenylate cyclase
VAQISAQELVGLVPCIAARIADYARPNEVLVSEEARRSAGVNGVEFELIGDVSLRGVSNAVRLHKATRA